MLNIDKGNITKEMQIKTILRFHLTSVRMAIIKKINKKMLVRMQGKRNSHRLLVGCKPVQLLWKSV
jgi:hypothetical protein